METYHKDQDYFTRSYLVNFLKSPLHAKTAFESIENETPALLFGQAYHALLAGTFNSEFKLLDISLRPEPDKTMASKLNKEWINKVAESGKLIDIEDYRKMEQMAFMLNENEYVKRMKVFDYTQEITIKAIIDGYKVKCRPDCIIHERSLIVDWKTTVDIPTNAYHADRLVRKYNYQFQAAMYCEITGTDHFLFFFQEKSEPFDVVPVLIQKNSELMQEGRQLWRQCAKLATECQKSGIYPGIASNLIDNCITL